ncbi:hypothetical protein R6Z07F_018373 [Ovis aries]
MGPSDAGGGTCAPSTPPGRSCRLPVIRNSRKRRNGRRVGEKKVRRGGEKSREDTTGEDKFLSVSVKSRVPLLTCDGKVAVDSSPTELPEEATLEYPPCDIKAVVY